MTASIRTILFVGRPGSGKETQARALSDSTGFNIFSSGEKFREIREHRDPLGLRVKEMYDTGTLMPTWFADYLFEEAVIRLPHTTGIILEGSGRTVAQATLIDEILTWLGRNYRVVNLVISPEEATKRQLSRSLTADRPDSNSEEKIRVRLKEYEDSTAPAIEYFRTKGYVVDIDGERSIEEIHADIVAKLGLS